MKSSKGKSGKTAVHVIACFDGIASPTSKMATSVSPATKILDCADGQALGIRSGMAEVVPDRLEMTAEAPLEEKIVNEHDTLKYSLLGPSLTKSGQDNVDQNKASLHMKRNHAGLIVCRSLKSSTTRRKDRNTSTTKKRGTRISPKRSTESSRRSGNSKS